MRRWHDGDSGSCSGVEYRIVQGTKSPQDLRLEFLIDGRWRPIRMTVGFLLADFFFENEDVLYPPAAGYRGGRKYTDECQRAVREGWTAAADWLGQEKAARRRFEVPE